MRGHVRAPDPAADLVELAQPEHVRALDDQRVRLRDVDARLDDRRRDEHVGVAAEERMHPLLQLALTHLPVRDDEAQLRAELLQLLGCLFDRLDAVVEVERLPAALDLALERRLRERLVVLADRGSDRAAALRRRLDDRDVAEPGERHVERARDGRRGEGEHVDLEPEAAQELLLRAPKRCSSSRMTRPRSLGITSRLSTRWVPTSTSIRPSAKSFRIRFVSAGLRKRETISTWTGKSR